MQGMQFQSLVGELDTTCWAAKKQNKTKQNKKLLLIKENQISLLRNLALF